MNFNLLRFSLVASILISTSILKAQETRIRFFGQPGLEQTYNPSTDQSATYFRGGPFVMYVTSQIGERISIAAEINPHYMVRTGPEVEIERIFAKFYIKDYFSVKIGRMYNPLGYWNINYNFGLVLQPTISRPGILQPLHDEGFTQTRDAGIQIEGNEIGAIRFFYKLMVGNGISKNGGLGGAFSDLGQDPGITGSIGIEPLDGFKFMLSGYYDKLKKNKKTNFDDSLRSDVDYGVIGASIVHMNADKKLEFIAEYFSHIHRIDSIGSKATQSGYIYTGLKVTDKIIPYLMAEVVSIDNKNPIFFTPRASIGLESYGALNLGVRYRFDPNVVLKFEYQIKYGEVSLYSFGPRLQVAFGF